jgi:hypothetical protein
VTAETSQNHGRSLCFTTHGIYFQGRGNQKEKQTMKLFQSKLFALFAVGAIAAVLLAACGAATVPVQEVSEPVHSHTEPHQTTLNPAESSPHVEVVDFDQTVSKNKKIDPLVFQRAVRKLWEDHVTWTRVYIIAALADLPEADAAAQRLLQSQTDIGNAVKAFYDDEAGEQLTTLLEDHILIAADLLAAAKAGDTAKFENANKRWYENADEIAAFLNSANPDNWPLREMQTMMKDHLDLTLEEATARLNGDWAGDVAAYDKVHNEILHMADMISDGIIKQFPKEFAKQKAFQQEIGLTLAMDALWEDHVTWTLCWLLIHPPGFVR